MRLSNGENILIGAFNVQVFGISKMSKPGVPQVLVKIIRRYDLLLFQEIRDSSQTAIYSLLGMVNAGLPPLEQYNMTLSPRLGRTVSKEQYAYIFKPSVLELMDAWTFNDTHTPIFGSNDTFQREPYIARFQSKTSSLEFSAIGIHTAPSDAVVEIGALAKVYYDVKALYNNNTNVMLMGDFNAGCTYVTKSEWPQIPLWTNPVFEWLIPTSADTTTGNSKCPYDRIVVTNPVLNGTASVFRFDLAYNLPAANTTLVSDHYPVDLLLTLPATLAPSPGSSQNPCDVYWTRSCTDSVGALLFGMTVETVAIAGGGLGIVLLALVVLCCRIKRHNSAAFRPSRFGGATNIFKMSKDMHHTSDFQRQGSSITDDTLYPI